jgi:hypothetical protein
MKDTDISSSTGVLMKKFAVTVHSSKQKSSVYIPKHTKSFNHWTCLKTFMNRILSSVQRICYKTITTPGISSRQM